MLVLAPPPVVLVEAGLLLAVVAHDELVAQAKSIDIDQAPVLAVLVAFRSLSQNLLGVEHRRLHFGQIALPDAADILVAEDLALAEDLDDQLFGSRQSSAVEDAVQQGAEQLLVMRELGKEAGQLLRCSDLAAGYNHLVH